MHIFRVVYMRVTVTNQVKMSGAGQCPGPPGIMFNSDAQRTGKKAGMRPMMMDFAAGLAASRGDEMLITSVVAINEMDLAVKMIEIRQHERRNKVTAVNQQFSSFLVSQPDRPSEMGDVILGVGADGDTHNDHGQYAWMAGCSIKMYNELNQGYSPGKVCHSLPRLPQWGNAFSGHSTITSALLPVLRSPKG